MSSGCCRCGQTYGSWTRPHPPLYVGGGARVTARRAARFRLPLSLADHLPDVAAHYRELCAEVGMTPLVIMPGPVNRGMIYLHEDPDRAWAELGEHILWEAVTYGGWSADQRSLMHLPGVQTLEEVRESGRYRFLTPDQLIAEVRDAPDYGPMVLHPLVGAMPVDEAWKSVQLLVDKVVPALADGVIRPAGRQQPNPGGPVYDDLGPDDGSASGGPVVAARLRDDPRVGTWRKSCAVEKNWRLVRHQRAFRRVRRDRRTPPPLDELRRPSQDCWDRTGSGGGRARAGDAAAGG